MNENKKAWIELVSYVVLSGMFAVAFFFGLLYPEYGMAQGTYQIFDESLLEEEDIDIDHLDMIELRKLPREKRIYRSYLLKCLETTI